MQDIQLRIDEIKRQIKDACDRSGRDPSQVRIVAVTKTVPVDRIKGAVASGLTLLGENRVQELMDKQPQLENVTWHLIGHLQTNKVKYIADKIDLLHSLDRYELAEALNKKLLSLNRRLDVLIQVNVAGEQSKFGIPPEKVEGFIEQIHHFPGIRIKGLMTVAPFVTDPEAVRPVFRNLKEKFERLKLLNFPGVEMEHLSMGMSNDFSVAVEEGATLIRLGSVIFGQRK